MNTNSTTEYIRAEKNMLPSMVWKFSALDRACFAMVIRGTWIFDTKLDTDKMKDALKQLLNFYPHLSGRMKDDTGIQFTNDGVPFTVADNHDLLVADIHKKNELIKPFSTEIKTSGIKRGIEAPLSIQITKLKDGSVLEIQCCHACMDGESFYTMVYNWGLLCKKEDFEAPVLDQSLLPVPENISKDQLIQSALNRGWKKLSIFSLIKLLPLLISGISKKRSHAFYFSADTINRLKQKISTGNDFPCGTNVALSAFISKMLIKLFKHTEKTKCSEITVVNIRNRVTGIPSTFIGNASTVVPTPPFSANASINEIAQVIHQTLKPILKTPSPELKKLTALNIDAMNQKIPMAPFDVMGMNSKKPTVFYINNFSKLHIYDVNFGSGKPVLVIPHNLSDPVVIWPAHPQKGGVEIYFSGIIAHRIHKLKLGDPWLQEITSVQ